MANAIQNFYYHPHTSTNTAREDLTVPGGMGGKETMGRLLGIDPQVKAIVSSGYSDDSVMADFQKYRVSGVIAKPYRISELAEILNHVIMKKACDEIFPPYLTREPGFTLLPATSTRLRPAALAWYKALSAFSIKDSGVSLGWN
jgi:DNA-binding NarL/FixJ family response regulator